MNNQIFNRYLLRLKLGQIAKKPQNYCDLQNWTSDILFESFCCRFADWQKTITKKMAPNTAKDNVINILEIGGKNSYLLNKIASFYNNNNIEKKEIKYWQSCVDIGFVENKINQSENYFTKQAEENCKINYLIADDQLSPFANNKFDIIFSNLNFHLLNLPELFIFQIKKMLKKGGMFFLGYIGEGNLQDLHLAVSQFQFANYQGNFAIIPPTISCQAVASLLQKTNFVNITSHNENLQLYYQNLKKLLQDIKNNAQGNFLHNKNPNFISKKSLELIIENYKINKKIDNDKPNDSDIAVNLQINFATASNTISTL